MTISLVELIKFISNKLGGTQHYELEIKKLARMRHLLNVSNSVIIADKNAVYFGMLSIGQLLIKSKYIDRFIKLIEVYI